MMAKTCLSHKGGSQQKRPYESYNGVNGGGVGGGGGSIADETMLKVSRLGENSSQSFQNAHSNMAYDMNSNIQPNINPFQQVTSVNIPKSNKPNAALKSTHMNLISNDIINDISPSTNSNSDINNILNDGLKKIDAMPNVNHIKAESPKPVTCDVSNPLGKSEPSTSNTTSSSYKDISLGDLDGIGSFTLFGEITGNTTKHVKTNPIPDTSTLQNGMVIQPSVVKTQSNKSISSIPSQSDNVNDTQVSLVNSQSNMLPNQSGARNNVSNTEFKSNSIRSPTLQPPLSNMNLPLPNPQHLPPNVQQGHNVSDVSRPQINQTSSRNVNLDTINAVLMNQQNQNKLNNMHSPLNNNPISPINMHQQQQSLNMNSMQVPSTVDHPVQTRIPPNLQRPPNLRQHIVEKMSRQQQQQQAMMSNMIDINNPYVQNSTGLTREKLQEHLKKRREHMQFQHQMSRNQFMNQQLMSQPNMNQQNPFQFPNDFQSYNQNKLYEHMNLPQQQQSPGMGFYPPPYQMDGAPAGQLYQGNPLPGYNQQNRAGAMLRNLMRDQQINEMYNAHMGVRQSGHIQGGMLNKAPPQYPTQSMESQHALMNQAMQNNSKLSHFTQPDIGIGGNSMGMVGGGANAMGQSGHMRMRNMNRYPAPPSLQHSASMPNNNSNLPESPQQFNNFPSNQLDLTRTNPSFNQNWTNEQQQLLYMHKQQKQQQLNFHAQQQQQHASSIQRQQYQQQQFPNVINSNDFNTSPVKSISTTHNITANCNKNASVNNNINETQHRILNVDNSKILNQTPTSAKSEYDRATVGSIDSGIDTITSPADDNTKTNDSVEDEEIDNLLNNPPEHFDLLGMFM